MMIKLKIKQRWKDMLGSILRPSTTISFDLTEGVQFDSLWRPASEWQENAIISKRRRGV